MLFSFFGVCPTSFFDIAYLLQDKFLFLIMIYAVLKQSTPMKVFYGPVNTVNLVGINRKGSWAFLFF